MEPVLRHGCSAWDQARVPPDEYDIRITQAEALLEDAGLSALLVFSDPTDPSSIGWVNGYAPTTKWAMLLVAPARQLLVAGLGGGRDHPHIRAVSAARDITYFASPGDGTVATLREWGLEQGRVGVVGLERCLPAASADHIEQALVGAGWQVQPVDEEYWALRQVKRPRELRLMAEARLALDAAVADARVALARGAELSEAVVAMDRQLRYRGFHDVRVLVSNGAGGMEPYAGGRRSGHGINALYVAGELHGYWAETSAMMSRGLLLDVPDPRGVIDRAVGELRSGADLDTVATELSATARDHDVELRRIGGALAECATGPLVKGEVIAAVVGAHVGNDILLASEEVVVDDASGVPLLRVVD